MDKVMALVLKEKKEVVEVPLHDHIGHAQDLGGDDAGDADGGDPHDQQHHPHDHLVMVELCHNLWGPRNWREGNLFKSLRF